VQGQNLAGGHPALIAEQLGQVAHAPPRRHIAERLPKDVAVPGRRPRQPEQQLHGRSLARAVRAEEAEDLAATHRHRQAGEGYGPPEVLTELVSLDGRG